MPEERNIVARILLQTESVLLNPDEPFMLTSGKKSPVYVDCRRLIAFPDAREKIMKLAHEKLQEEVGFDVFDSVAGGETAGIAYAAWLAEAMHKPMAYIRKQPKSFGRNARIEGNMKEGERVLLVEDLATDAGSKISFVNAIRNSKAFCEHCFVVFYYDIFEHAKKKLEEAELRLHYLATWHDVMEEAKISKMLPTKSLDEIQKFLDSPEAWYDEHNPPLPFEPRPFELTANGKGKYAKNNMESKIRDLQ